jgi:hypothetical protein
MELILSIKPGSTPGFCIIAGGTGFKPVKPEKGLTDLQSVAFSHSATPATPMVKWEKSDAILEHKINRTLGGRGFVIIY